MDFMDRLESSVAAERARIITSPFATALFSGRIGLDGYEGMLRTLYHHVRETSGKLATAAWRCSAGQEALKHHLSRHAAEESGHEHWILEDLEAIGVDPAQVRDSEPRPECMAMIAHGHFLATMRHPAAILAEGYFVESLSQGHADTVAARLRESLGIPESATRFLSSHGELDQEHAGSYTLLFDEILDDEGRKAILRAAPTSAWLYAGIYESLSPGAVELPVALAA
jgi:pyrroloquinoline quinone (PQQ) biosynthesis protein C